MECTSGEVIVNSGVGSHTPCFSLDSALGCASVEAENRLECTALDRLE